MRKLTNLSKIKNKNVSPNISKKKKSRRKGKKQLQFTSENQPASVNEKGIEMETESMRSRNVLYGVFALIGALLCIFDIRDKGMTLEFIGLFKYSGSLVGVVMTSMCIWGMMKNAPKVTIK